MQTLVLGFVLAALFSDIPKTVAGMQDELGVSCPGGLGRCAPAPRPAAWRPGRLPAIAPSRRPAPPPARDTQVVFMACMFNAMAALFASLNTFPAEAGIINR